MATRYGIRDLYGGTMTVELPVDFIDSSNLRQIPDHQEVFLSPTTLTSLIFEVNNYLHPETPPSNPSPFPTTTTTTTSMPNGTTTTTTTTSMGGPPIAIPVPTPTRISSSSASSEAVDNADADAAREHFTDVISPPDSLASPLPNPLPVTMAQPRLAPFAASILTGNISNSPDTGSGSQRQSHPSLLPSATTSSSTSAASASSSTSQLQSLVHQLQLLVRLPEHEADLCVRINVPLKELDEQGVAREVGFARDVLARIVGSLDITDWRLFEA